MLISIGAEPQQPDIDFPVPELVEGNGLVSYRGVSTEPEEPECSQLHLTSTPSPTLGGALTTGQKPDQVPFFEGGCWASCVPFFKVLKEYSSSTRPEWG
jgi:hypothetical protein